jgi:hypothetical protein
VLRHTLKLNSTLYQKIKKSSLQTLGRTPALISNCLRNVIQYKACPQPQLFTVLQGASDEACRDFWHYKSFPASEMMMRIAYLAKEMNVCDLAPIIKCQHTCYLSALMSLWRQRKEGPGL